MSYDHFMWENRVFLYGWANSLHSDRIEDRSLDRGTLNIGFFLKVMEMLTRVNRVRQTVFWCKARGKLAEQIKLEFTTPRWIRVEGLARVYNGATGKEFVEGKSRFYVEILHMWWQPIDGRSNSTVVCLRTEWERLKKIEEAWTTGRSRFHIPKEKIESIGYLHDEDEEPKPNLVPAQGPAPGAAEPEGPVPFEQAHRTRKKKPKPVDSPESDKPDLR